MTADDLLWRLQSVRQRGGGRWSARCPSHDDRNPSLSVTEGERGLLLRCFAGCSLQEICGALKIQQADLFFDQHADPETIRAAQRQRVIEQKKRRARNEADGVTAEMLRDAERFVVSRRNIDIARLTNEQLDAELSALGDCYALLESEGRYES